MGIDSPDDVSICSEEYKKNGFSRLIKLCVAELVRQRLNDALPHREGDTKMSKIKRIRKTFTYRGKRYEVTGKTEEEANEKLDQKKQQVMSNVDRFGSNITLSQWIQECTATYKTNQSEITRRNFVVNTELYISRHIGDMKLTEIKNLDLQRVLNQLEGMSEYVIKNTRSNMKFFFDKAKVNGLIETNPAENLILPRGNSYEHRRAMTKEEENAFLNVVGDDPHTVLWLLMYSLGCRPSEAENAKFGDIENSKGNFYFENPDDKPYLHIRGTKTKNADRLVPIPKTVMECIQAGNKEDLICTTMAGTKFQARSRKRAWKSLIKRMNIELGCETYRGEIVPPYRVGRDLVPYCLRHTFCTNLCRAGVDPRKTQLLMGHSDPSLLMKVYTHLGMEDLETERNKLELKNRYTISEGKIQK